MPGRDSWTSPLASCVNRPYKINLLSVGMVLEGSQVFTVLRASSYFSLRDGSAVASDSGSKQESFSTNVSANAPGSTHASAILSPCWSGRCVRSFPAWVHGPFRAPKTFCGSTADFSLRKTFVNSGACVLARSGARNLPTPWWWLKQPPASRTAWRAVCSKCSKASKARSGDKPPVQTAMYMYKTPPSSYNCVILHERNGFPGTFSLRCSWLTADTTAGHTRLMADQGTMVSMLSERMR
mmetsp:Transcript_12513/g.37190  ORF Transcript_12513/g.37190 Transcript_12513/m.37190 type:complete len:239 (+) Transcript_12513:355-1071(+)